jgi:hypothetical protein
MSVDGVSGATMEYRTKRLGKYGRTNTVLCFCQGILDPRLLRMKKSGEPIPEIRFEPRISRIRSRNVISQ